MTLRTSLCSLVVSVLGLVSASAHCQIPCGIYDDDMRFNLLAEHITTIEKSISEINTLASKDTLSALEKNQLVRWVANKEDHADDFASIVTKYFLQQRVKPAEAGDAKAEGDVAKKVTLLHKLLVGAMKCKQNVDPATAAALREDLAKFKEAYTADK